VQACLPTMQALQPDLLIVDHYALDIRWEDRLRPLCRRLMVIDDLADRSHQCDLLLDQNLGTSPVCGAYSSQWEGWMGPTPPVGFWRR
jgi:spore coat polysaccharide biosynthesis predicted glycosyltransferase SpsG